MSESSAARGSAAPVDVTG